MFFEEEKNLSKERKKQQESKMFWVEFAINWKT